MSTREVCFPVTSLDQFENRTYVSGSYCNVVNFPVPSTSPKPILRTDYIARPLVSRSEPPTPRVARSPRIYQSIGMASTWIIWQRLPAGSKILHRNSTDGNIQVNTHPEPPPNLLIPHTRHVNTPESSSRSYKGIHSSRAKSAHTVSKDTVENQSPRLPEFPRRQTTYIRNLKKQKRSVSAKPEKCSNDSSTITYAPVLRVNTAPSFPVHNNVQSSLPKHSKSLTSDSRFLQPLKKPCFVGTQTLRPFDKQLEERIKHHSESKRGNLKTTGIVHSRNINTGLDRRVPLSELDVSPKRKSESYIASIRRDYLQTPHIYSIDQPRGKDRRNTFNPHRKPILVRQDDGDIRIDYILQYSPIRERTELKLPKEKLELNSDCLQNARSTTPSPTARSNTPNICPHYPYDKNGDCMGINLQKMIQDKRFYLRTPEMRTLPEGAHSVFGKDLFNCNCDLCNIEVIMYGDGRQDPPAAQVDKLEECRSAGVNDTNISVSKLKETWSLNEFRIFLHGYPNNTSTVDGNDRSDGAREQNARADMETKAEMDSDNSYYASTLAPSEKFRETVDETKRDGAEYIQNGVREPSTG